MDSFSFARPFAIIWFAASLLVLGGGAADAAQWDFNRDVRPILSDKCFKCHGPDAANQDSEFRVDSFANATADLGGYAGVVPGDLRASLLHARIHDADDPMPPADDIKQLTESEKQILDDWILQGAAFDKHWSFKPLPAAVPVPELPEPNSASNPAVASDFDATAQSSDSIANPIDAFVAVGIAEAGLGTTPPLPKAKWLRRVTFDLTGLPPTLAELDAYLADDGPRADETVVDRLLNSDACAERLTTEWLDIARYSDSYGYQRDDERFVWPYRDWVIKAFRENLPYDDFITWQLAGDLLPNATQDQRLATVFNRLHSHKKEGGVAIEEFRVENVADRTHTVGAAMMGLTFECTRCHDHKYDPLTMQDYYGLSAFFDNVDENGLISYFTDAVPTPAMPLPSEPQQARIDQARVKLAALESRFEPTEQRITDFENRFQSWLKTFRVADLVPGNVVSTNFDSRGTVTKEDAKTETGKDAKPENMVSIDSSIGPAAITPKANSFVASSAASGSFGDAIELTGDDAVVFPGMGHYGRHDAWTVSLWIRPAEIDKRGVIYRRSRGWDDAGSIGYELTKENDRLVAKLCHFWPGDAIAVATTTPLEADRWYHVAVSYDGSSQAAGLNIFLDGQPADTEVIEDHLTRHITKWNSGYNDLAIGSRYRDRGFKDGMVDQFDVFERQLSDIEITHLFDGQSLIQAIALGTAPSNDDAAAEVLDALRDYFRLAYDPISKDERAELQSARAALGDAIDATPAITIMREESPPRQTFILDRGVYDAKADPVVPQTPAALPPMAEELPRNRLGLARWLTDPNHPLTARVAVNRYWQLLMGNGLVRTPEDFGNQGQNPTHPELLDWLSRRFVDSDWDVRALLKTIALSDTYRRSPVVTLDQRNRDPDNIFYARGTDVRLTAEMIRDNVLATSGLLVHQVGGPPVKPYDVALAYTPLPVDEGDKLYRRSLYTYWKRTSPTPVMMTLNTPTRAVCRMKREITNTPLQALVMMNGPQFVEAARVMASELISNEAADADSLDWIPIAFRRLTSRSPSIEESELLRRLYQDQFDEFDSNRDAAKELLSAGKHPIQDGVAPARHAAATVLINAIMNLDEAVRHQG